MVRTCGNQEDAEDVLIEALLRAYRSLDQLKDSTAFRAWLAQIGRRVCWRLKGREKLLPVLQLSALEDSGGQISSHSDSPEAMAASAEMSRLIHAALDNLEPGYSDVYRMRDLEGVSGEDAAERLGITLPAMKSRLHRARAMMRESLDRTLTGQSDTAGA
jgi:RNA polymerase sigma-70 factor (ECF subfamily)